MEQSDPLTRNTRTNGTKGVRGFVASIWEATQMESACTFSKSPLEKCNYGFSEE